MSSGSKQRNKQQRIDNLGIQKSRLATWWQDSDKSDTVTRVAMAAAAAVFLLIACLTWRPPFAYRHGAVPGRNLVARASFKVPDPDATEAARDQRRRSIAAFYRHRTEPLDQLRARLRDRLLLITSKETFEDLDANALEALDQFQVFGADETPIQPPRRFELLRKARGTTDDDLRNFEQSVRAVLENQYKLGVLESLQHEPSEGIQSRIQVYYETAPETVKNVSLKEVQIADIAGDIDRLMAEEFRVRYSDRNFEEYSDAASLVSRYVVNKLPEFQTLMFDPERTSDAAKEAAKTVEPIMVEYEKDKSVLAKSGVPLDLNALELLRREWNQLTAQMRWSDSATRMLAYGGMLVALYLLAASYIYFVGDRRLILQHSRLAKLLVVMAVTITAGFWLSGRQWRTELVPLTVGAVLCGVVYRRELAMLLMTSVCVALALFMGADISELVVMAAASISIVLLLGRIRTRTRLLSVGATSAAITILTVIGVGVVTGQTLNAGAAGGDAEPIFRGPLLDTVFWNLTGEALLGGFAVCVAAAVMTPFLPLVEKAFGVQTDLSLLELGDASDPLLRRLAQRAPGTYNHSINVASIAEAAAEEIGANGLLVRVGAYFHDIGKMFKPEYFIENQNTGINQHDSLQPAMSTLVIIAHVKDGADLARSHSLPEPIVDLILQHHGTTLVEYFFREAARRSEENPNKESVNDKDFRYPGPKPQTLEAAVMMLADTVESASRTLVDPTPARIRNLVNQIAEKKVSDGQFDECGMTFRQLSKVRDSLVKSLTAIYHARIKYPGQPKSA